jgi:rubrerythrin
MTTVRRELAHPELLAVEVHGMTRQSFLLRGAIAAVSAYGAGAAGPFLARALAQEGTRDVDIANFAYTLELLEVTYYQDALKEVRGLGGEAKRVAREIRDSEAEHIDILNALVRQLGGIPARKPKFDFGGAYGGQASFLSLAQTFEDTGVSAYNGAAPLVESEDVLDTAGRIVQVEARHAAVIRFIRGEEIAPAAFDKALEMKQVDTVLDRFIQS